MQLGSSLHWLSIQSLHVVVVSAGALSVPPHPVHVQAFCGAFGHLAQAHRTVTPTQAYVTLCCMSGPLHATAQIHERVTTIPRYGGADVLAASSTCLKCSECTVPASLLLRDPCKSHNGSCARGKGRLLGRLKGDNAACLIPNTHRLMLLMLSRLG